MWCWKRADRRWNKVDGRSRYLTYLPCREPGQQACSQGFSALRTPRSELLQAQVPCHDRNRERDAQASRHGNATSFWHKLFSGVSENTMNLQHTLEAGLGDVVAACSRHRTPWSNCTETSIATSIAWAVIRPGGAVMFLDAWCSRPA